MNENVLNKILEKNIAKQMLKRIFLSSTMKLFKIVRFKVDARLLNAFNNATPFIFNINKYAVSIYICI